MADERASILRCTYIACLGRLYLHVLDFLNLKMELIGYPETSVMNYHFTLRNMPPKRWCILCGGDLKQRLSTLCYVSSDERGIEIVARKMWQVI